MRGITAPAAILAINATTMTSLSFAVAYRNSEKYFRMQLMLLVNSRGDGRPRRRC